MGDTCGAQLEQLNTARAELARTQALLAPTAQRARGLEAALARGAQRAAALEARARALEAAAAYDGRLRAALARLALGAHDALLSLQLDARALGAEAARGRAFWPQLDAQVARVASSASGALDDMEKQALLTPALTPPATQP